MTQLQDACLPEFELYTQTQGVPVGAPAGTDNSSVGYRGLCQHQRTSTETHTPAHMNTHAEGSVQTLMAAEQAYDGGRLHNVCKQSQYSQSDLRVLLV